jgi:hypothetical protein
LRVTIASSFPASITAAAFGANPWLLAFIVTMAVFAVIISLASERQSKQSITEKLYAPVQDISGRLVGVREVNLEESN